MFSKKMSLQQASTSKIIYDLTYSTTSQSKQEDILFSRLQELYKLDSSRAKKFIEEEQLKMNGRGSNLDSYLFGSQKSEQEALKIFYTIEKKIDKTMTSENYFKDITFSELAVLAYLFQSFIVNFSFRSFEFTRKMQWEKDRAKYYKSLLTEAEELLTYYELLKKCSISKMNQLIGNNSTNDSKSMMTAVEELKFLRQQTLLFQHSILSSQDLSSDCHYEHQALAQSCGTDVYVFRKK